MLRVWPRFNRWRTSSNLASNSAPGRAASIWHDPLVRCATLVSGLLMGYQLVVMLVQPPWNVLVTLWLQALLTWLVLLILVLLSRWMTHTHQPRAPVWWAVSAGEFFTAIGRSLALASKALLLPALAPFPAWENLFFLLAYPCYFLALALWPMAPERSQPALRRVRTVLDSLLLMGAATALSWYFLLQPAYLNHNQSSSGLIWGLVYLVGDLVVLLALIRLVVTPLQHPLKEEQPALALLMCALAARILGDSCSLLLRLDDISLPTTLPSLFWIGSALVLLLAALVQWRLLQRAAHLPSEWQMRGRASQGIRREDVRESLRFLLPLVIAVLVSGSIVLRATLAPIGPGNSLAPLLVAGGLLAMVLVRQEIVFLEYLHLQRERTAAQASALALRELNQRMDAFLMMAAHVLRTPLTILTLHLQLAQRRLKLIRQPATDQQAKEQAFLETLKEALTQMELQAVRLSQLNDEFLEIARFQAHRLELHRQDVDLMALVQEVTQAQHQQTPAVTVRLRLPDERLPLILADSERIKRVVASYLTTAIQRSITDRPIDVGIEREEQQLQVWVHDQGPAMSVEEQHHLWERFIPTSPSEVLRAPEGGLALTLYLCRIIIEQHGGNVGVHSEIGQGSTFWFTLPRAPSENEAGREHPAASA